MTVSRSIRVPEELEAALDREFRRRGIKEWSAGVLLLLQEAVRMGRVPGVVFVDSLTGRRAAMAGSGIEVWEVIASLKALGGDRERLRSSYEWLSEAQLQAALHYYDLFPAEIDERIALDEAWTPERVRAELPFASSFGDEE